MIQLFKQLIVPVPGVATNAPKNGAVESTPAFHWKKELLVSTTLITLTEVKTIIPVAKPHNHTYPLDSFVAVANFKVMNPSQARNTKPVPHAQVLLMNNHPEECEHNLNQILHEHTEKDVQH